MCQNCDKEIIDLGILESDLPNLPYKIAYWHCVCDGCKGKTKIRDYGTQPLYYWPVRITRKQVWKPDENKEMQLVDVWRGGWMKLDHGYICSKHFAQYKLDADHFWHKYLHEHLKTVMYSKIEKYLNAKISYPKEQPFETRYRNLGVTMPGEYLKDMHAGKI